MNKLLMIITLTVLASTTAANAQYNNPYQYKAIEIYKPKPYKPVPYKSPTTSTRIGNYTFNSDGTSSQRMGNMEFKSDGTFCQTIGATTFCN